MKAERTIRPANAGGERLLAMQQADGHGACTHYHALMREADPPELADLVHFLCLLHGRRPGVIDQAATRLTHPAARSWIVQAADGFAMERQYLTQLTVAAGPVSGVSEDDHSEAAAVELRGSFQLLSTSERRGCAAGAALAFALDWWALRDVLDLLANRLGIAAPFCALPRAVETAALADRICADAATARAFMFGADQLFQLQRGAWRLLDARAKVRAEQS